MEEVTNLDYLRVEIATAAVIIIIQANKNGK